MLAAWESGCTWKAHQLPAATVEPQHTVLSWLFCQVFAPSQSTCSSNAIYEAQTWYPECFLCSLSWEDFQKSWILRYGDSNHLPPEAVFFPTTANIFWFSSSDLMPDSRSWACKEEWWWGSWGCGANNPKKKTESSFVDFGLQYAAQKSFACCWCKAKVEAIPGKSRVPSFQASPEMEA